LVYVLQKKDGKNTFKKLSTMFEPVSKKNGRIIAEYTDRPKIEITNTVQYILIKDKLYHGKYKLLFRIGSLTYFE
jgi:hypothetical protein